MVRLGDWEKKPKWVEWNWNGMGKERHKLTENQTMKGHMKEFRHRHKHNGEL